MEAEDDVRDDPEAALREQRQRALEVVRGQVEVIDVADRLVGADDVEHHAVDARLHQPFGEPRRDDPGVDDDAHSELIPHATHCVHVRQERHTAGAVGPARNQHALRFRTPGAAARWRRGRCPSAA